MSENMIMGIIVFMFLLIGFISPFITAEFGVQNPDYDVDAYSSSLGQDEIDTSKVGMLEIAKSVISVFFWSFNLPAIFNIILMLPRVILLGIIIDKIADILPF